jgi:uncharacterized protein (TIGR03437 family)
LPTELAGVRVRIRDANGVQRFAQLHTVLPTQINYLIPPGTATGLGFVEVLRNGQRSTAGQLLVEPLAPGLFTANQTGEGVAAAIFVRFRGDGSSTFEYVFEDAPGGGYKATDLTFTITEDTNYLYLYGTGMRAGMVATATIGGVDVPVTGPAPSSEFAGLDQVNLGPLPGNIRGLGEVEIRLVVDGIPANPVTVKFR